MRITLRGCATKWTTLGGTHSVLCLPILFPSLVYEFINLYVCCVFWYVCVYLERERVLKKNHSKNTFKFCFSIYVQHNFTSITGNYVDASLPESVRLARVTWRGRLSGGAAGGLAQEVIPSLAISEEPAAPLAAYSWRPRPPPGRGCHPLGPPAT